MAKLRDEQIIDNNRYIFLFSIDPKDVSEDDRQRMHKYGEPTVDFGGSFDNGSGLTFTLPSQIVKVVSGLPKKVVFDSTIAPWTGSTGAAALTLYRTTMISRVAAAFTALRAYTDTFTGEYVTNI